MKKWPVLRLVAFDHCRSLAPWCAVRGGQTPVLRVRQIAHQLKQNGEAPPSLVEAALAQLAYLLISIRQIWLVWRPAHRGVRRHYGIGPIRQLRDLLVVTWRGNLPSRVYYFQRLFRRRPSAAMLSVIDHQELQLLLRALHTGIDTTILEDKVAFHEFCATHGLPTPPILAAYSNGAPALTPPGDHVWKADLFCKPARSYSSHGISLWRYDPVSDTHQDGKISLDRPALQRWLSAQSDGSCVVVQPRMNNSADLAPIGGRALANCRVVTARRPDGSIIVLLAALRMGVGAAVTSDEPTKSFCAAVNLQTGVLAAAETKQAQEGSFDCHPDSGELIAGRTLTRWPEMRALVLRAHALLPQMIFVGWDVIDTDQGAMLLEGNLVWGGNLAQMAGNLPLGVTEFPEIFLHFHKKLSARPVVVQDPVAPQLIPSPGQNLPMPAKVRL